MQALLIDFCGAILRWALGLAGAYLVTHHVLTADQSIHYTTEFLHQFLLAAPAGLALLWSLWAKYRARQRIVSASQLPPGASDHAIQRHMRWITWRDILQKG